MSTEPSNPILTNPNIGVDHPEENTTAATLFGDARVNRNYYSPKALVKKIKEEFYKDGKKIRNASEFLKENYENFEDKVESLLSIAGDIYNESEAELATYFLIKKEIPTLLNNRYLQNFKERCEKIIEEIEQRTSSTQLSIENNTSTTIKNPKADKLEKDIEGQTK